MDFRFERTAIGRQSRVERFETAHLAHVFPGHPDDIGSIALGDQPQQQPFAVPVQIVAACVFGDEAYIGGFENTVEIIDPVVYVRVNFVLHPGGGRLVEPVMQVVVVDSGLDQVVEFMGDGRLHQLGRRFVPFLIHFKIIVIQRHISIGRMALFLFRVRVIAQEPAVSVGIPGVAIQQQFFEINVDPLVASLAPVVGRGRPAHLIDLDLPDVFQRLADQFGVIRRARTVAVGRVDRLGAFQCVVDQEMGGSIGLWVG